MVKTLPGLALSTTIIEIQWFKRFTTAQLSFAVDGINKKV